MYTILVHVIILFLRKDAFKFLVYECELYEEYLLFDSLLFLCDSVMVKCTVI